MRGASRTRWAPFTSSPTLFGMNTLSSPLLSSPGFDEPRPELERRMVATLPSIAFTLVVGFVVPPSAVVGPPLPAVRRRTPLPACAAPPPQADPEEVVEKYGLEAVPDSRHRPTRGIARVFIHSPGFYSLSLRGGGCARHRRITRAGKEQDVR